MEQRYDAVLGVLRDGFTVTEVAKKFGVSRQSVHSLRIPIISGRPFRLNPATHSDSFRPPSEELETALA
jgi:transposase-like protein